MNDADFDLSNIVGLLRRQVRLILITVVLVVGATALVLFTLTPIYEASALILVDTSQKNLLDPNFQANNTEINAARVDSEVEIVQSPTILLRVIADQKLVQDPEFGVKLGLTDTVLAFLQIAEPVLPTGDAAVRRVLANLEKSISVSRRDRTNLITMTVASENPQKAADIANSWAKAYIADQVAAKVDSALQSRNVLQARIADARQAVVASESSFDSFVSDNLATIIKETGRQDLDALRTELQSLGVQTGGTSTKLSLAQNNLAQGNYALLADTLGSDALRELARQRDKLSATLPTLTGEQAIDLRSELDSLDTQLASAASGELDTMRKSITVAQARQADIRQQIRTAVLGAALPPETLTSIYDLQQKGDLARNQYQALTTRVNDLDAQVALQVADSRVASEALPASRPSFPNTNLTLVLAALSSLGLGVLFAFVNENVIGGLMTEEQTESVLRIPTPTAVPLERAAIRAGVRSLADLLVTAPLTPFPEAIRRIKVFVDQTISKRFGGRSPSSGIVLMVTSSTANEGKSTISLSIARAYALARRRTLIIDCDFRKPSLHKMTGLNATDAFVEALWTENDAVTIDQLTMDDPLSSVKMILASRPADVPTDQLVSSASMTRIISQARQRFDVVVIDTPPVGPVVDGLYLARQADAIAFVVRSGGTSQAEARSLVQNIVSAKLPEAEVFAVLNEQLAASASYKSRYASYYYKER